MSVNPSRRARIIAAIADRLALITVAGGYATDAGQAVFVGVVPALGESDPSVALALVPEPDSASGQTKRKFEVRLPLTVTALVRQASDDGWMTLEAALADVKTAIEGAPDPTFGGLIEAKLDREPTRPFPRQSGNEAMGVSITYLATYQEAWGDPIGA